MDLTLPDSQGLATLELVQNAAKGIPLIVMTGIEDEELAIRAIRQGAQDYLVKGRCDGRGIARAIRYAVDRKKAEEAIRASETRYRTLFNSMTEGFALHEIICNDQGAPCDYRFLDVNPAFERLTGLKREDVVGKTHNEVLPNDNPRWVEKYGAVALTGEPIQFEDYSPEIKKYFEVYAHCPAPRQFAVLFMDITKRKQAEEVLATVAAERIARETVAAMEEGVVLLNMSGTIVSMNPAMERISGYRPAEAIGRDIASFFPAILSADDLQEALERLRDLTQGKQTVLTPLTLSLKDGRKVSVVPSVAFIRSPDGKPHSIVLTLRDITQMKRIQDELRQANNYNRSLIEASLDPLATIGPDGKITDVNAATEAATGCSRKELIGADFLDYFTEPEKARAVYREVFCEGIVRDYPLEIRHRNGRIISVLFNASVYRNEGGGVVGVFAAARDITRRLQIEEERKRLADRVIEIQEEERKNISSMLHDNMGQLLTLARLDLERLRPKDERSKRVVRDVLQWLSEVIAIVRDMAVSLRPPMLDNMRVETALESLVNDFTKGSKIKFTLKHKDSLPELDADKKTCLYRVLQEALTNAVKHSGASHIDVVLGAGSKSIWLEIRDKGKGFDVDARRGGKGIGLVNMRERVRQCGGAFNVSSVVGQGSMIYVEIPLAEGSE